MSLSTQARGNLMRFFALFFNQPSRLLVHGYNIAKVLFEVAVCVTKHMHKPESFKSKDVLSHSVLLVSQISNHMLCTLEIRLTSSDCKDILGEDTVHSRPYLKCHKKSFLRYVIGDTDDW